MAGAEAWFCLCKPSHDLKTCQKGGATDNVNPKILNSDARKRALDLLKQDQKSNTDKSRNTALSTTLLHATGIQ